jgi:hypothetical protein
MLELARAVASGDTVLEKALQRYNDAAAEMANHSALLITYAQSAHHRATTPHQSPALNTSYYTDTAIRLAIAEQTAWQALQDIAMALEEAGHDVNW